MKCVEGAGTGGVESHGWPLEVEDVVDAVTQNRDTAACDRIRQGILRVAVVHELMVVVEVPHERPSIGARELPKRDTGGFEGLVDDLEELPLSRVQGENLLGMDPEEACVEFPYVRLEKTAALSLE